MLNDTIELPWRWQVRIKETPEVLFGKQVVPFANCNGNDTLLG